MAAALRQRAFARPVHVGPQRASEQPRDVCCGRGGRPGAGGRLDHADSLQYSGADSARQKGVFVGGRSGVFSFIPYLIVTYRSGDCER